jgi:hypothetical protein
MERIQAMLATPSWAYTACYYYAAVAAILVLNAAYALFRLFSVPSAIKRLVPTMTMSVALILSSLFIIVLTMMQFWICRGALAPARATKEGFYADARTMKNGMAPTSGAMPASGSSKEPFAVTCSSDADCTAVMGTQAAGSLCNCGGRGFCGGCMMNNNMEPQDSFAAAFAPIEPFASMSPQLRKVGLPKPSKMPMRK